MYFAGQIKPDNYEIIHFIGIGGIGMSGIAEILHNQGFKIQGSDLTSNNSTKRLENLGIKIFVGHAPEHLYNVKYVVVSSAITSANPELIEALNLRIPVIKRSEMLSELMRLKFSIAIAGSHGKTTTTSLVASMFEYAGLAPTVINGGIINGKLTNAYTGVGNYLIAEADESDATFINIPAMIGVITNIDAEHMDFYDSFENLVNAFKQFILRLPFYGFVVACIDNRIVKNLIGDIHERKILTYGIDSKDANIRAVNIRNNLKTSEFDVYINLPSSTGQIIIENIVLPTPGRHNVLNALAAIAIGTELNFGIKIIRDGFKHFQGVKRRFTNVGSFNQAEIIDDYAHHPEEVKVTLSTAKNIALQQSGKVIAVFQPHRFSRMKNLMDEFSECFFDADILYIMDVYSAGEKAIEGINSENLVKLIRNKNLHSNVIWLTDFNEQNFAKTLKNQICPNDIILMMGAGNITSYAHNLQQQLELL